MSSKWRKADKGYWDQTLTLLSIEQTNATLTAHLTRSLSMSECPFVRSSSTQLQSDSLKQNAFSGKLHLFANGP